MLVDKRGVSLHVSISADTIGELREKLMGVLGDLGVMPGAPAGEIVRGPSPAANAEPEPDNTPAPVNEPVKEAPKARTRRSQESPAEKPAAPAEQPKKEEKPANNGLPPEAEFREEVRALCTRVAKETNHKAAGVLKMLQEEGRGAKRVDDVPSDRLEVVYNRLQVMLL